MSLFLAHTPAGTTNHIVRSDQESPTNRTLEALCGKDVNVTRQMSWLDLPWFGCWDCWDSVKADVEAIVYEDLA